MAVTDLTNTKWILNNNWTSTRGYGIFSVNLTYNNSNYTTFYIGHNPDLGAPEKNVIGFNGGSHFFSGEVITFTITGGTDVKHTSLISWLNSNATQIIEPEYTLRIDGVEVTNYENVIINGVSYKCKQVSVPTDLTGYTVTVPAGWTASAGLEEAISISVNVGTTNYVNFSIGYQGFFEPDYGNFYRSSSSNFICIDNSFPPYVNYTSTESFTFQVVSGDITNQSLIQWLVDNNATFELIQEVGGSN